MSGKSGLNAAGKRIVASTGKAALGCNCCINPPTCCVLPPTNIFPLDFVYADYAALPSSTFIGTFVSGECTPNEYFSPTPTPRAAKYKYLTTDDVSAGAPIQTPRVVLLVTCDGLDFCVNGGWYYGPAQMFYADEDWNPITHIDNVPRIETVGCVLKMGGGAYWPVPANNDHMPDWWKSSCACAGNGRLFFTPCPGTGGVAFTADFDLSFSIVAGNTYRIMLSSGFQGCYTASEAEIGAMPTQVVIASSLRDNCDDGDCAPVVCDGPPYYYRLAYCIDPLTPIGYYVSADAFSFGDVFKEIGTTFPRYIVLYCNPPGELPEISLPGGIEAASC